MLEQGRKDRDFSAKDALQPVLKLLLGPEGEQLRVLVIKESVRVTEAILIGSVVDASSYIPDFMHAMVFNGNSNGLLVMKDDELKSMIGLRDQVVRIWGYLRTSDSFDPSILQPLLQVRFLNVGSIKSLRKFANMVMFWVRSFKNPRHEA